MRVTAREAELIRTSFRAVAATPRESGRAFYGRLFALDPTLEAMFVADVDRQADKLVVTLKAVADCVDRWVEVAPLVEALAVRHLAYGVRPEHYAVVGEALIAMLRDQLGVEATPEILSAWRRVYGALETQMTAAAYPVA
jgi:nitric oxide dioxygenase